MDAARSRFTRRAILVLVASLAGAAGIAVLVARLLPTPETDAGSLPLVAVVAVVLLLIGLAGAALWNGIGLLRIRRQRPDALVFLARREPSLAPDLPLYLHRKDVTVDVSDKWVAAVIDERGMATWSSGPRPKELFVMEWSELGDVAATEFRTLEGHDRFGISVDVRPFATPLIVRVGYSMFGLQGAFDREGTLAVAEAASARRPVSASV